eukprot:s2524_g7.t1
MCRWGIGWIFESSDVSFLEFTMTYMSPSMGTTGSCDSGGCKQCCEKKCQGPSEMQEYQPQNKKQMLKESVEMHPPAAVKRSEGENALEDVMADSYFARELEDDGNGRRTRPFGGSSRWETF